MAYANRKYHSGWMWTGVTSGLAGIKFSGSPKSVGENKAMIVNPESSKKNPKISLYEKYAWKVILSMSELSPVGLLDPVS